MTSVTLDQESWNRVLAILAQAPWQTANPLIMAIGEQLRYQQAAAAGPRPNGPDEPIIINQAKPQ